MRFWSIGLEKGDGNVRIREGKNAKMCFFTKLRWSYTQKQFMYKLEMVVSCDRANIGFSAVYSDGVFPVFPIMSLDSVKHGQY